MCKDRKNSNTKYTIQQFRLDFRDDSSCLERIFTIRYGKLTTCPDCEQETTFKRVSTRQCYQCSKCYHQIYPCAGTIFEKTRTPLTYWFYVIYLFTASKNGISAYEVQRQIGVTYKTAWRMLRQIRVLTANDSIDLFTGTTEMDETFVGGKNINRHKDKKVPKCQGRSFADKTPVLGIYERETKRVRNFVIDDTSKAQIQPLILQHVEQGTPIMTDEWVAYQGLGEVYEHKFVNHRIKEYVNEDCTTNRIENFWSVFKRTLKGSYIQVSKKYLQLYTDEVVFRFNNRESDKPIFDCFLNLLAS
ncbi:MAG: IS1595 family transposase [Bacteroidota bacterium]